MYANWYCLSQLSLGDATGIIFFGPPITFLMAHLILGEPFSCADASAMTVSFLGVLLFARPPALISLLGVQEAKDTLPDAGDQAPFEAAGTQRLLAVASGLAGAVFSAGTNILVRKLKEVHAMVVVAWLYFAAIAASAFMIAAVPAQRPTTDDLCGVCLVIFVGIAISGLLGQFFKTEGLKREDAGPAAMMRNLDLVFAFIFQTTLLGEPVLWTSLLGGLLTLSASASLGVSAIRRRRLREEAAHTRLPLEEPHQTRPNYPEPSVEGLQLAEIFPYVSSGELDATQAHPHEEFSKNEALSSARDGK
jgi:drug/metabolite transporter (DMT)-like permease